MDILGLFLRVKAGVADFVGNLTGWILACWGTCRGKEKFPDFDTLNVLLL
jgi:hypothetical protein